MLIISIYNKKEAQRSKQFKVTKASKNAKTGGNKICITSATT